MELTNYSFLQSRNDYMSTIAERKVTADRIATGKRLENAGEDVGAIHQAAYQETELRVDRQSIVNLKNLRSFLFAQENSLRRVHEMYEKMEVLAIKSANPMTSESDRKDYEIEYIAYREQLAERAAGPCCAGIGAPFFGLFPATVPQILLATAPTRPTCSRAPRTR